MKTKAINIIVGLLFILSGLLLLAFKQMPVNEKKNTPFTVVKTNVDGKGTTLEFTFFPGEEHNHPTLAVWVEDLSGDFIQPLYVTKSLATGIYGHGQKQEGVWSQEPGEARRPATLPYFLHKRDIKAPDGTFLPTPDNPIADAYTGATPKAGFNLNTKTNQPLAGKVRILAEVNQPWDWNEFWHNSKFPGNTDYMTSCQPSVVYAVTINFDNPMEYYVLNPIGHGHYAGEDGSLYTDLTTFTTALNIFSKIQVTVKSIK